MVIRDGKNRIRSLFFFLLVIISGMLVACSGSGDISELVPSVIYDWKEIDRKADELISSRGEPGIPLSAVASGEKTEENESGIIDYSNTSDGYVMVCFTRQTDKELRALVSGPENVYTYVIRQGEWNVFPLSDGDGEYTATLYESVSEGKYAAALSAAFDVSIPKDTDAFLRPNQYVDYSDAPVSVATAEVLCGEAEDTLGKVEAVYEYVVKSFKYDYEKARTVQSGYLPVLDVILAEKKGICFDYASLMTGMLRSQGVPCKLVTGYAGDVFHAWINVWVDSEGWVDKVIYFDGKTWQMMDPTFASNTSSRSVNKLIEEGETYQAMYFY